MVLVDTKEINGTECEIHASGYGAWLIKLDGETIGQSDASLNAAVANARNSLNKTRAKVSVPFRTTSGKRGVAHGIHGKSRKVLARMDTGEAQHFDTYNRTILQSDTPDEVVQRLMAIDTESKNLEAERRKLMNKWQLDLSNTVRREIDQITAVA